ncbi:response regulator [bacterium]|nr:response regulator [candidate division CSSED10-310 bacterium]
MSMKLLLADENPAVRKAVQIVFRSTDTQVALAQDTDELHSVIKSYHPDILLLSSSLPGLNVQRDIDSLARKSDGISLPVILMADRSKGYTSKSSRQMGAAGYLTKPLDDRELKIVLERVLKKDEPPVQEADTTTCQPVIVESLERGIDEEMMAAAVEMTGPIMKETTLASPEQRAKILMEILESYLNENVVLLTDSLAANLAPRIAPEVAGKIVESIDFSELSFKIATIVESVIQDLVPQLAENLITQEIEKIKEEAARLVSTDDPESESS